MDDTSPDEINNAEPLVVHLETVPDLEDIINDETETETETVTEQDASGEESSPCSDSQDEAKAKEKGKLCGKSMKSVSMHVGESDTEEEDAAALDLNLKTFREAFALYDPDKRGVIVREQLNPCLQTVFSTLPDDEIEQIISQLEGSDQDEIDFKMFTDMARYAMSVVDRERELLEAFRAFDPEHKGYMTAEDLNLALLAFDRVISDREAQQLIGLLVTKEGKFYYEPFVQNLKEMGVLDEL